MSGRLWAARVLFWEGEVLLSVWFFLSSFSLGR